MLRRVVQRLRADHADPRGSGPGDWRDASVAFVVAYVSDSYELTRRWANSFNAARSCGEMDSIFSARIRTPRVSADCQHSGESHKYAPRPERLPEGSMVTLPSGVLTMRTNCRLAFVWRHATQVRWGTCRGRFLSTPRRGGAMRPTLSAPRPVRSVQALEQPPRPQRRS